MLVFELEFVCLCFVLEADWCASVPEENEDEPEEDFSSSDILSSNLDASGVGYKLIDFSQNRRAEDRLSELR